MSYAYSDDMHLGLAASYRADDDPFPMDMSLLFPHRNHLREDVNLIKRLLFPRCQNARPWVIDEELLRDGVVNLGALCYFGIDPYANEGPKPIVNEVVRRLPDIREQLKKDVEAVYEDDPAARSCVEIIRSYSGVQAIVVHWAAYAFYEVGTPAHAHELTEYAKIESGVDIHPDVTVGDYSLINHGVGVVISETTTIGKWARICQNVTLGMLHFEEDEDDEHSLREGYKRHPDAGDGVVIGTGTKVLGAVSVGDRVSIGANSWVTEDVPDHTGVYISEHPTRKRKRQN